MLRAQTQEDPLLRDNTTQSPSWFKRMWKRMRGKPVQEKQTKQVDRLIKRKKSRRRDPAAATVDRVIAEWREQNTHETSRQSLDVSDIARRVSRHLAREDTAASSSPLTLQQQPQVTRQSTATTLEPTPTSRPLSRLSQQQLQPQTQHPRLQTKDKMAEDSGHSTGNSSTPSREHERALRQAPKAPRRPQPPKQQEQQQQPAKPTSRPKSQLSAAQQTQSSIKRKAASSIRRQQSLRREPHMKITKERLKYFSVQPLHLREKLQRWCRVTDFANPQAPPKVATPTPSRQGSICESLASLQDWQTYAYKLAAKRRTLL
eukprot:m.246100 g.246100  ORF g.246100 m.246100 type:complete len:317 (-) comp15373_c0_seq1:221-1171(-)